MPLEKRSRVARYCRTCGKELSGRKRSYCSDGCRDAYYRHQGYMLPDWSRKSVQFLKAHPICQKCGIVSSTVTHHKIPRRLSGTDDEGNLMAVCSKCHKKLDSEIMMKERIKYRVSKQHPKRRTTKVIQFELPFHLAISGE